VKLELKFQIISQKYCYFQNYLYFCSRFVKSLSRKQHIFYSSLAQLVRASDC
jgi:hypothetical protein